MIKNIVAGIKAYFGALGLISKLKLWKYFTIPILISLIVALIVFGLAYGFYDNLGVFIANIWIWEFGKETFGMVSNFISFLLILTIGLILYKHIVMALSAPFMSPVSEKIELHYLGTVHQHRNTTFKEQLSRGIRISLRNLFKEIKYTIPVILFGFIPVIGLLSTVILFLIQSFYAGFGNMDYTLERHFNYKESIAFVQKNKGLAIGNGIVFILFLLLPVIGVILVLPLSVTAATTETIKQIKVQE